MTRYIDGFVIPLAKDKIDDYRKLAEQTARIWTDHGAIDYWECIGDDVDTPQEDGPLCFAQMAGATDGETVVFAWAVFESREQRDEANKKIMADP